MLCWGIAFQLRRQSKAINLKVLLNYSYLTLWRFSSKGLFYIIVLVPFYTALKGGLSRWIPCSRNIFEQIPKVDFFRKWQKILFYEADSWWYIKMLTILFQLWEEGKVLLHVSAPRNCTEATADSRSLCAVKHSLSMAQRLWEWSVLISTWKQWRDFMDWNKINYYYS